MMPLRMPEVPRCMFRSAFSKLDASPGTGAKTYVTTPEGIRRVVFSTKLQTPFFGSLLKAERPPTPIELRRAIGTVDRVLGDPRSRRVAQTRCLELVTGSITNLAGGAWVG